VHDAGIVAPVDGDEGVDPGAALAEEVLDAGRPASAARTTGYQIIFVISLR